ncbi:MAG: ring-cleaving dioxygenase [Bacteroidota bacterium]
MIPLNGIHHITVLASDPQKNIDFYVGFLGLRLVKKTVNFDAPDVYHFYYGDETGRPGTVLTFFPFPDATKGRRGVGETTAVAFSILPESMEYWIDRLAQHAIHFDGPVRRFNEDVLAFEDPDGMMIELVANPAAASFPVWKGSAVDPLHAPRAFHGATFAEAQHEITAKLLIETMGFRFEKQEGERYRYLIGSGETEAKIDILSQPKAYPGNQSAGSVHHIAWRVATDEGQTEWQKILSDAGMYVTSVQDRQYFHSIYFREPGGVLFEIATDGPGMLIDESLSELGTRLKLPPWFEPRRERIEQQLISVRLP